MLLKPIKSKYQIQEQRIIIRKVIMKSGKNIDKNGQSLIYIEIVSFYPDKTKKTKRIPTGIRVLPKDWNQKKNDGEVRTTDPDHIDKNGKIDLLFQEYGLQLTEREMGTWNENFIPENLITINDLFPKKTKGLTEYIDDYITYRKSVKTPYGTLKEFKTLKNRIVNYENNKNVKLTFKDMNMSFSDSFYSFMLSEKNDDGEKKYQLGTIEKSFVILRTILNYYYERRDELNIKDLSDRFRNRMWKRGEKSENEPNPPSKNEFDILVKHDFHNDSMNKIKDRFLIQSSVGCRFSDLTSFTIENFKDGVMSYYPKKTIHKKNNLCEVPLNPLSKSLFEKYNYDTRGLKISNQKYNKQITKMFETLDKKHENTFRTDYTSHNGRDFFITQCLLSGIDVPSVLKMVGQSEWKTMKKYLKITSDTLKEKMNGISVFN